LVLSSPSAQGGGGQAMPDGRVPQPGGWNRFSLEVDDIEATVSRLRGAGATFRNDIVTGVGGRQILVDDPSGNPVELFEPAIPEARRENGAASHRPAGAGHNNARDQGAAGPGSSAPPAPCTATVGSSPSAPTTSRHASNPACKATTP